MMVTRGLVGKVWFASGFAEVEDGVVRDGDEWLVVAVVADAFVGLVFHGVVRSDVIPAAMIGTIGIGAMKKVAVEEDRVAGIEFEIDEREAGYGGFDVLEIGHGLFVDAVVIDAAHGV